MFGLLRRWFSRAPARRARDAARARARGEILDVLESAPSGAPVTSTRPMDGDASGAREGSATAGSPPVPGVLAARSATDVATESAAEVRARIELLRLSHGGASADVDALLDALAAGPADAVRQLPSAAQEALAVCNDPWASFAELARVCGTDPTVAQGLLKHANSVFYARAGQAPAVSIRDAITRVGAGGVRSVLLDIAVHGLLCQPGGALAGMAEQVWSHMIRTAPVARVLAPAFGVDPERAYALGLLHDVGKLVLIDHAAALRARLRRAPELPAPFLRDALRSLHEPLGALAALRWGLGPDAAGAIGAHHRTPPTDDATSEVLFLAERAELAATRGHPLDLAAAWTEGALRGAPGRSARALAAHYAQTEGDGARPAPTLAPGSSD